MSPISTSSAESLNKRERYQLWLTAIGTLGGIATILFGIYSYTSEQEAVRRGRIQELNAKVWERRIQTYSRVARNVSAIAVTCDSHENLQPDRSAMCENSRREFWKAYWGDMSLIEDKLVELGMIIFGKAVRAYEKNELLREEKTITTAQLKDLSYYLAHVYRKSLSNTWNPEKAFDSQVLITAPLHRMYEYGMEVGLDIENIRDSVVEHDPVQSNNAMEPPR